ncbi:hypothetical protein F7725_025337 [Dissostichus mawsoni]|uniref:C-CAP/cofactor C-like domain-containing protein n=1 Tax=Dissostichus mawsoni TaxID=36200 RepID=A0A7J5XBA8_DISMA|nr:hypothetical protein F7725_025337 [Dissostichus mawsoni]
MTRLAGMAELAGLVQRLEVAGVGWSPCRALEAAVELLLVEAFDGIASGSLAQYLSLSQKIGGDVQKHADMMKQAFSIQKQLLQTASSSQKPSDALLTTILQPMSKMMQQVQTFREQNRSSPLFNHLSAVSESVPALGWVAMAPKPGPFVKEMQDAAMFYTNRGQGTRGLGEGLPLHRTELQNYIKQYHTTGLTWSKSLPPGLLLVDVLPLLPRTPPPPMDCSSSGGGGGGDGGADTRNALFASLNKGGDVTTGLKHVSDDQKTHKNPTLRGNAPVRAGPKPFTSAKPAVAPAPTRTLPPVLELDGKKWKVENQEGVQDLVISDTELKQVVYAYKCNKSTLQVKGKINSITIDNCKKLGLVFDDVVGIVEIINCKDVKVQVMGKIPTISINKTDGCHVYLSQDSLACEIVSAKSSEMNILVPNKEGEFTELPVPEQFKTVWDGKKLVTTSTEIAG